MTRAIERATGTPFVRVPTGQTEVDRADGTPLLAGETDGRSYLLDLHAAAIAYLQKLLLEIARESNCLMISATFDSNEPSCHFFAARSDKLLRHFWHHPKMARVDYSLGDRLDCELETPLSAHGGSGMTTALQSFGFHQMDCATGFQRSKSDFFLTWAPDYLRLFDEYGNKDSELDAHIHRHANPNYVPPTPQVRVRKTE